MKTPHTVKDINEENLCFEPHHNKLIVEKIEELFGLIKSHHIEEDYTSVKEAFWIGHQAHIQQKRKDGMPYIIHPIEVAIICIKEIGLGKNSIIVSLLHDVIEDSDIFELNMIKEKFSPLVGNMVEGLTKIRNLSKNETSVQSENFAKLIFTMQKDLRTILIKLADRLHNMRTLEKMSIDKQVKIISETQYFYISLAHKLGLNKMKAELEDLCFKYKNKKKYTFILNKIKSTQLQRAKENKKFIEEIDLLLKKNIKINYKVKYRLKSISSIYNKMKKQKVAFEDIYDIFAIRIVFDALVDKGIEWEREICWRIFARITNKYTYSSSRLRDWISRPKQNGYESLHVTIINEKLQWVEIQIRSSRMDDIAEKGYASHWKYKQQGKIYENTGLESFLKELRIRLEEYQKEPSNFIEELRTDLFSTEVSVITPKGEIKNIKKGATILDMAFSIHTDIGLHYHYGKVNHQIVPIDYELQDMDSIEIFCYKSKINISKNALEKVKTSKAKNRINQYLTKKTKKEMEFGKELLERKFHANKVPYNDVNERKLLKNMELKEPKELYIKLINKEFPHSEIKKQIEQIHIEQKNTPVIQKKQDQPIQKNTPPSQLDIVIGSTNGDSNGLYYEIAKCCQPITGDDIFGFVNNAKKAIVIHKLSCENSISLWARYSHRIIDVYWKGIIEKKYKTKIQIYGADKKGISSEIISCILNKGGFITSIHFITDQYMFKGVLELELQKITNLKEVIDDIYQKIEGIEKIEEII